MNDTMQPRRSEAAVYVRRIKAQRVLYTVGLIVALAVLFLLVVKLCRNTILACILLLLGGIVLYSFYARVLLASEASISSILTQDLDPELFSLVFRQTLKGSRHFPSLQTMMEVTEAFYLGDYARVVNAVRHSHQLWSWTQPEFISYYVQSACAMGLQEEAEDGLSILAQAHGQKEYEDEAVRRMIDRYEQLALAAYRLITDDPQGARESAASVYEDAQAPELCTLYAAGYLATACALTGDRQQAMVLRQDVLTHSPAFGMVRHLRQNDK